MSRKFFDTISINPLVSLLVISGLFGILLGFDRANLQVSVQTGQVLAGIVEYPINNPNLHYHLKVFTIATHLSALLLYITSSEILSSYVISCMLGVVLLWAFSVVIYAVNRDVVLALVGALFIYYMGYVGTGVIYPILMLGNMHTFGVLGLFFMLFSLGLLGAGAYRGALFSIGIAPYVHPSLACWLAVLLVIAFIFQPGPAYRILRLHYKYFIAGFLISLVALFYQLSLISAIPETSGSAELKRLFFNNYILYWDQHRIEFFRNYATGNISYLHPGYYIVLLTSLLSFLVIKFFKGAGEQRESGFFLLLFIFVVAGPLSLIFAATTHIDPSALPAFLLSVMPGRFANLSSLALAPLLLGVVTYYLKTRFALGRRFITVLLLLWFFLIPNSAGINPYLFFFVSLVFTVIFALLLIRGGSVDNNSKPVILKKLNSLSIVVLIPLAIMFIYGVSKDIFIERSFLGDRTNVGFFETVAESEGMLLVTSDFYLTSLKTRRPVLLDVAEMDGMAMVPGSVEGLNDITEKVYGVNLLTDLPPPGRGHSGEIDNAIYRDLWEARSTADWILIKREFGVTEVLTKADWKLRLPVVEANNYVILYAIPGS